MKRKQEVPAERLRVEHWPIERLQPYERNPRSHSPEKVAQLASAIGRFGFRVPLIAKADGSLVDGHFRLKAAQHLGLAEVPVVLVGDLSDADLAAFRLSVNRMAELASWDGDKLLEELEALQAAGERLEEGGSVGFELEDVDKGASPEAWDFGPTRDEFVVTLRGSLPLEAEVRSRLAGLDGVVIECSVLTKDA